MVLRKATNTAERTGNMTHTNYAHRQHDVLAKLLLPLYSLLQWQPRSQKQLWWLHNDGH